MEMRWRDVVRSTVKHDASLPTADDGGERTSPTLSRWVRVCCLICTIVSPLPKSSTEYTCK